MATMIPKHEIVRGNTRSAETEHCNVCPSIALDQMAEANGQHEQLSYQQVLACADRNGWTDDCSRAPLMTINNGQTSPWSIWSSRIGASCEMDLQTLCSSRWSIQLIVPITAIDATFSIRKRDEYKLPFRTTRIECEHVLGCSNENTHLQLINPTYCNDSIMIYKFSSLNSLHFVCLLGAVFWGNSRSGNDRRLTCGNSNRV